MKKFLTILLLMIPMLSLAAAERTLEQTGKFVVCFEFGGSDVVTEFGSNGAAIEAVERFLAEAALRGAVVGRVVIEASTSPEGRRAYNRTLAQARAVSMAEFLIGRMDIDREKIEIADGGIGWSILRNEVAAQNMRHSDRVIHLIDTVPEVVTIDGEVVDGLKKRLMELDYGRTYRYMIRNCFAPMRCAVITFVLNDAPEMPVEPVVAAVEMLRSEPVAEPAEIFRAVEPVAAELAMVEPAVTKPVAEEPVVTEPVAEESADPMTTVVPIRPIAAAVSNRIAAGVKTNILYDAAITPNLAAEIAFGRNFGFSAEVEGVWAWWRNDKKHHYWRIGYTSLELRRWLGNRTVRQPLTGWYLGLYGAWGRYDFEFGGDGQLSDSAFSLGLSTGYSLPLSDRLNLELGIAGGFIGGEYKTYTPMDDCYVWQGTFRRKVNNINNWMVTRARVALVWTFGEAAR